MTRTKFGDRFSVARYAGSFFVFPASWGSAPLHPRLATIMKLKRAKRAIEQTPQVTVVNRLSPTSRAATFYFTDPGVPLAELASPQALRYRRAPRAKTTTHNELSQSFRSSQFPKSFSPDRPRLCRGCSSPDKKSFCQPAAKRIQIRTRRRNRCG
jgi:hypothetical protein